MAFQTPRDSLVPFAAGFPVADDRSAASRRAGEEFPVDSTTAARNGFRIKDTELGPTISTTSESFEQPSRRSKNLKKNMKFLLVSLAALCVIACTVEAQLNGRGQQRRNPWKLSLPRFRRQAQEQPKPAPEEPRGSIVLEGRQPLDGPDREPTLDLKYQHRIIDNDRTTLDAFGGANLHRGHVSPHAGFDVEHRFKNDIFLHGGGQVQPGPRGRLEPSFGAGVGWRFRREAQPYEAEQVQEEQEAQY